MAAMRATARTSPFCRACPRIRVSGFGLEKVTWPIAKAERAVMDLWLIGMTCTVEVAVRCGREERTPVGEDIVSLGGGEVSLGKKGVSMGGEGVRLGNVVVERL